jgi:hypothetical protein
VLRAITAREARVIVAGLFFFSVHVLGRPRPARASAPLGPQGTPIETSAYALDLFQGPVLASSRVTAMGGAYAGLAEGPEGIPSNAAAASQRYPYSTTRLDYEITGSLTFPASVQNTDFDNNGGVGFGYRNFVFGTLGGFLQYDRFGVGTNISLQNYGLGTPPQIDGASDVRDLTVRIFKVDAVASYGFFREQLHIGGGLRAAVFTAVDTSLGEKLLLGTYGVGAQGGVLWRPRTLPFRLGATLRSPVIGTLELAPNVPPHPGTGDRVIGRFYLPSDVDLPWEAEWGVSVQLGERPLNIPWTDEESLPDEEVEPARRIDPGSRTVAPRLEPRTAAAHRLLRRRYRMLPRQKVLLSFAMTATGPTPRAVGVESMLTQIIDRSGQRSSVTIRGGAEVELLPNRLQLRAGSYMEPTRFRESRARLHGTTGFELNVVEWSLFGIFPEDNSFRISGALDVAREYFGWSLAIGSWY